jgi:hypothetical protein
MDGMIMTLESADRDTTPRITDEAVAQLRGRVGIPQPHPVPPHCLSPNTDTFRIVARSYGDDNPLWSDPDYPRSSRWGQPIAPPSLVGADNVTGEDIVTAEDLARRHLLKGDPLRGVHLFCSATVREWWAPLRADGRVDRRQIQRNLVAQRLLGLPRH